MVRGFGRLSRLTERSDFRSAMLGMCVFGATIPPSYLVAPPTARCVWRRMCGGCASRLTHRKAHSATVSWRMCVLRPHADEFGLSALEDEKLLQRQRRAAASAQAGAALRGLTGHLPCLHSDGGWPMALQRHRRNTTYILRDEAPNIVIANGVSTKSGHNGSIWRHECAGDRCRMISIFTPKPQL